MLLHDYTLRFMIDLFVHRFMFLNGIIERYVCGFGHTWAGFFIFL